MADFRVTFTPNTQFIDSMFSQGGMIGSAVVAAAEITVQRAQANVSRYGRVRTGAMRAGIRLTQFSSGGDSVTQQIEATERYSIYQHQGTRRGIRPAPFLTDALDQLRPDDFRSR